MKVDVEQMLLSVGSLRINIVFLILRIFFVLSFLFFLVGGSFLPLRINCSSFTSLSQIKFWLILLSLEGFPFVKGQLLWFFFLRALILLVLLLVFIILSSHVGLLNRGVNGSLVAFLDIIFHGSPVSFTTASSLVLSFDASS